LVAILAVNSTLESVSLDRNYFTSLGVYTIADAVAKKKNIRKLSIEKPRAKISSEEVERLLQTMERESYLHEMRIDFRDEEHTERLKQILKKNKSGS